ncbi:DUF3139 domain-containing protein [Staphylococcus caprae]|uniref:DUF3139 domain-containing protein n=1 Tax=Staphylococcus caprae TaxID=29380 RepID=UPI001C10481D|nr:DUF3139 domain-containing protein [Staphylococcus caprae]MBU5271192.1 DUF3139 domain-containing protein [Staphylococcus caprae]MDK6297168.1 DUF3139 domain-containing protein [Staphylococcus caprae]MDK7232467.1 DUF3139 domain-containing protein [Staphylococcus caprae]
MKRIFKILGVLGIIVIIVAIVIALVARGMHKHEKQEEAKLRHKVHHVFKQKGWENKVKTERNIFTFNTGYNDLEVTFKDEPYNTYTYSIDEDNRVTGDAVLKDKYDKKPKHYKKEYELK